MKLSKSTIEKCHEAGINIYDAKKETNKLGTWITLTYADRYFKDGVCSAISTEKKVTIGGRTQQDIIKWAEL